MESNEIFEDFMTTPTALAQIAADAASFYWEDREEEDYALLHKVFLLNEFCAVLKEIFDQTAENEIEVPDDLDLDLIVEALPVIAHQYGHHAQVSFIEHCMQSLRSVQGTKVSTDVLLMLLPLASDVPSSPTG